MKKLLLACCLGAAMATTAYAEPSHPSSEERLAHMQKALQLTDAQAQKVKPILEASEQQRKALAEKYKISEYKAFREEMGKVREQTHAKLAGVLTPQQVQAMEAQREHRKHRRFHRKGGDDCKPGPGSGAGHDHAEYGPANH
jgi:Spy/CpxP family protein refolding chaperone